MLAYTLVISIMFYIHLFSNPFDRCQAADKLQPQPPGRKEKGVVVSDVSPDNFLIVADKTVGIFYKLSLSMDTKVVVNAPVKDANVWVLKTEASTKLLFWANEYVQGQPHKFGWLNLTDTTKFKTFESNRIKGSIEDLEMYTEKSIMFITTSSGQLLAFNMDDETKTEVIEDERSETVILALELEKDRFILTLMECSSNGAYFKFYDFLDNKYHPNSVVMSTCLEKFDIDKKSYAYFGVEGSKFLTGLSDTQSFRSNEITFTNEFTDITMGHSHVYFTVENDDRVFRMAKRLGIVEPPSGLVFDDPHGVAIYQAHENLNSIRKCRRRGSKRCRRSESSTLSSSIFQVVQITFLCDLYFLFI